ncbi:unnamed protein product [Periconia digitata]|uniref:DJ-1/PfpI domain-containing protein n=1 Tax=Periconia digitata TaxID=1303443 RepID=A0A9W4XGD2_9PLEO|nr:unnamed protein product [Periconia digitata]
MYTKTFTILMAAAISSTTFAQDVAPPFANTSATPVHFGILLHSAIQPIDLFGPLDVLTGLVMSYRNVSRFELSVLSVNSTPAATGSRMGGLDFEFALPPSITLAQYRELAASNFTTDLDEPATCPDKAKIRNKGPIDVLLVPGGGGTRADVSNEIDFVKEIYPKLRDIISVCTGSTILARAGVLDNKKATTNKKAWAWATTFGTNVDYQTHARWVQDGNVWTGSGVSAASDTAYAYVAHVFGDQVSQWVADSNEYTRWLNASYDPFADRWGLGKANLAAA